MKLLLIPYMLLTLVACQSRSKAAPGESFPSFDLFLVDSSTRMNTHAIKKGQPIALLYFSPDCEHCQEETQGILQHMNVLKDVHFLFVTIAPFERMQAFNGYYKLSNYPNIMIGKDEQFFFLRHFKDAAPPYLVLYDREQRQSAVFKGQTNIDTLIHVIDNL